MDNAMGYVMGYEAGEAIQEFRFLTVIAGKVEYADAITERVIGISQQETASGERASTQVNGVSYLVCDGSGTAIAIGDRLMPKAGGDGIGVKAVGATAVPGAVALEEATGAGAVIRVQIINGAAVVGT